MSNTIKVGDLVIQRNSIHTLVGLVLDIKYGRSTMPKNEPDMLYKYASVHWSNGHRSTIKISLLRKYS